MLFNNLLSLKITDTYSVWFVITFICIIVFSQTILLVALIYGIAKKNKRSLNSGLQKSTASLKTKDTFAKKKSLFHIVPIEFVNCLKDFYYEEASFYKMPEKVLELPANNNVSDTNEIVQEIRHYGYLNHTKKIINLKPESEQNIVINKKNKSKIKHLIHPASHKGRVIQNSI